jgi:2-polyprenyl-6-methoxyphenol hydroxylase-like FAD-dependent oxidoreductase
LSDHYDAIIIGGAHSRLVCGAYIARYGLKVKVLERRARPMRRWRKSSSTADVPTASRCATGA